MIDRCHRPAGERDRPTLAAHSPGAVTASCTFLWYFSGRFPAVAKPMSAMEKPVYRFGEFELDPDERRLLAHGEPVALTPKVFDTLVLLVERAGHAVSKDELMHALWPRGFVDESNLTKHVWLIRKALDDGGGACIETVPKHGYRFTAAVERAALRIEQAEAEAYARFEKAKDTARRAGDPEGVVRTPEFHAWMAARADTDAAWGRWALLMDEKLQA